MREDGGRFQGARGTYCWNACVDYIAHVSNVEPIILQAGEKIAFHYAGPPAATHGIRWQPVFEPPTEQVRGQLLWRGAGIQKANLVADSTTTPLQPGRYLVAVFAQWEPWGDASYGFFVEVVAP